MKTLTQILDEFYQNRDTSPKTIEAYIREAYAAGVNNEKKL